MTFLELEKKCKRRRLLRIIKILLLALLLVLFYFLYIFLFENKEAKRVEKVKEKNISEKINRVIDYEKKKIEKNENKKIDYINKKIVIEKNVSKKINRVVNYEKKEKAIEKNNKNEAVKNEAVNLEKVPTLRLFLDFNITYDKNEIKKDIKNKKALKKEQVYKKNIDSKKSKFNNSVIKTAILPPFDKCILLANKYYKEGNYKEALKWVKNANIQDNKRAISWILTAKILNKMGKKKEAIKLLKLYYNFNKDEKVKKLMEQLNE